jgi:hypothetical protein
MSDAVNWDTLTQIWLGSEQDAAPDDPHDIRRRVRSESRRMLLGTLLEYAVGLALVCLAAWTLATDKSLPSFVWGFALLWFTATALQFSSSNRRGLWEPAGHSTRDYLALARERLLRRRLALRFAWLLYALEVLFLLAWYPASWFFWPEEFWPLIERTPQVIGALALVTLAIVGWSVHVSQRIRIEGAGLARLQQELEPG